MAGTIVVHNSHSTVVSLLVPRFDNPSVEKRGAIVSLFQTSIEFPASLSEKYRPHDLADFVGLEKPKRVLAKFAASPFPNAAFLFVGPGARKPFQG
jgi:hypothetical protein